MSADPFDSTVPQRSPANWIAYVLAAATACGIAGLALDLKHESLHPYRWGPNANASLQNMRGDALKEAYKQLETTGRQGGSVALGVIAGALAFALCLVDAAALRRPASFVLIPIGAAIGAAGGAAGGQLGTHLNLRLEAASGVVATMGESIIIQTAAWICAGLGVALGVWIVNLGRRPILDTLAGGVLAGGLAGVLYPPAVSLLFPDENTDRLFPEKGLFPSNPLIGTTAAFIFWAVFTGVVYALILGSTRRREPKVAAPPPNASV